MIRIPFSSVPEARLSSTSNHLHRGSEEGVLSEGEKADILEARIATLEIKLVTHAEELKAQVSERVLRIQSRLENALKPFAKEDDKVEAADAAKNVVAFACDSIDFHHLHATNALEALNELNQTLRLTREHLEALSCSIDRMRQSVVNR